MFGMIEKVGGLEVNFRFLDFSILFFLIRYVVFKMVMSDD